MYLPLRISDSSWKNNGIGCPGLNSDDTVYLIEYQTYQKHSDIAGQPKHAITCRLWMVPVWVGSKVITPSPFLGAASTSKAGILNIAWDEGREQGEASVAGSGHLAPPASPMPEIFSF